MYLYYCWFGAQGPYPDDKFDNLLKLEEVYCHTLMFGICYNYNFEYKFKIEKK